MMDDFNAAPIMLRRASSLDKSMMNVYPPDQSCYNDVDEDDLLDEPIDVPQNLEPEQYQYEFPPKSRLQALAQFYNDDDEDSFFDESSFTTGSTSAFSSIRFCEESDVEDFFQGPLQHDMGQLFDSVIGRTNMTSRCSQDNNNWCDVKEEEECLVEDSQLSPLQLPAQVGRHYSSAAESLMSLNEQRAREQSCDSAATVTQCRLAQELQQGVAPSSFLSVNHDDRPFSRYDTQGHRFLNRLDSEAAVDLPVFYSESELYSHKDDSSRDDDSEMTSDSRVVLIRLRKTRMTVIRRSSPMWAGSDEGYDDELDDEKELPIESASVFLPLSEKEQARLVNEDMLRTAAAVKIQAAWRGYRFRKTQQQQASTGSSLKTKHRLMVDIVRLCGNVHRQQMNRVRERVDQLEYQLREETAMRVAFEKAMEDMTVLVDQQQRVLYERVEQETNMRQAYERKIEDIQAYLEPLEAQLEREANKRRELESMMAQVLEQMHELKLARQQDEEEKLKMKQQLDDAVSEIAQLKGRSSTVASKTQAEVPPAKAKPSKTSVTRASSTVKSSTSSRPFTALAKPSVRRTMTPASRAGTPTTVSRASSRADVKRPATRLSNVRSK